MQLRCTICRNVPSDKEDDLKERMERSIFQKMRENDNNSNEKMSTPELKQTNKEVQGPGESERMENGQQHLSFKMIFFIYSHFKINTDAFRLSSSSVCLQAMMIMMMEMLRNTKVICRVTVFAQSLLKAV